MPGTTKRTMPKETNVLRTKETRNNNERKRKEKTLRADLTETACACSFSSIIHSTTAWGIYNSDARMIFIKTNLRTMREFGILICWESDWRSVINNAKRMTSLKYLRKSSHASRKTDLISIWFTTFTITLDDTWRETTCQWKSFDKKRRIVLATTYFLPIGNIVGAGTFHFSVRNGKRWFHAAPITRTILP